MSFFLKLFKLLPPELSHSFSLNSLNILYKFKILKFFIKTPSNEESFDFVGLKFKNRLGTYADTTAVGADAGGGSAQGAVGGLYDENLTTHTDCRSIQFIDTPNTTSAVDYKIYVYLWDTTKPVLINRPNTASSGEHLTGASSLVLMELAV